MSHFGRRKRAPSDPAQGSTDLGQLQQEDIDSAMRDIGYVDREGLEVLRERLGVTKPLVVDYEIEPDKHQKQRVIEKYNELAAYLNSQGHDGRRDWTPRQAWSLGRATTAQQWGHDPAETLLPLPWPGKKATGVPGPEEGAVEAIILAGPLTPADEWLAERESEPDLEGTGLPGRVYRGTQDNEQPGPVDPAVQPVVDFLDAWRQSQETGELHPYIAQIAAGEHPEALAGAEVIVRRNWREAQAEATRRRFARSYLAGALTGLALWVLVLGGVIGVVVWLVVR